MHVSRLALTDFRSYPAVDLELAAGVSVLVGANGAGKTNLLEALRYVATLDSHRVASTAPLVRTGAERAVVRVEVHRDGRPTLVELEIVPGRSGRARVNRAPVPRPREVLGIVRCVLFAPEDLGIVKGDPAGRRAMLDELLVARAPRYAAVRADYERVLRQRTALLKSAGPAPGATSLGTLDVWDAHLARTGAELLAGRLELLDALRPLLDKAYTAVSADAGPATAAYQSTLPGPLAPDRAELAELLLAEAARLRRAELERGVCLVGPHRDELALSIGELPARGYASQGESWSLALALRLAGYELLRAEGGEPVLLLDDVFAELDVARRERLAELVAPAEQVLVTAAVPEDVPGALAGRRYAVTPGAVRRD